MGLSTNPQVRLLIDCIRGFKNHDAIRFACANCMSSNSVEASEVPKMICDYPGLARYFDVERNHPNTIHTVPRSSKNILVHWRCPKCEHRSVGFPKSQNDVKGCRCCRGQVVHSDGRNSLLAVNPRLASEFHPIRNYPLTSSSIKEQYNQKIWWKCTTISENPCGHEWEASGNSRAKPTKPSGCPYCSGRAVHIDGRNSMESLRPDMADDFDYDKNSPNTPRTLKPGTNLELHWKCVTCEHEQSQTGDKRLIHGCAYCRTINRKSKGVVHSSGKNSLLKKYPEVAADLHPTKNIDEKTGDPIRVDQIYPGTHKIFHWKCRNCDHEWKKACRDRTEFGKGCAFCSQNRLHSDRRNSMLNTNPQLASEFHPERNGELTPNDIKAGYPHHLWWLCPDCNLPYPATGANRHYHGSGCPSCNIGGGGFDPAKPGYYYVNAIIAPSGDVVCYKGGKSNNEPDVRFRDQQKSLKGVEGFENHIYVQIEAVEFDDGVKLTFFENELLAIVEIRYPQIVGFDGGTELFVTNPLAHNITHQ